VKEYVKRGESSATVYITLSSGNPAKPTVVTRKVTTDNKSEWKLNGACCRACCARRSARSHALGPPSRAGAVVTQAKVVEAVAALNIQLDNLCQFLPQDRVVAFAQMSPTELLLETEKAFGARELFEQHTRLMEDKQGMKELETAVASTAASVETLKTVNAGLERDVERFQARAALLEKVEAMKAKLPWVRYEAARAAHETAKEDVAAAKKTVRAP
jgi:chromosome segregation ATPase